MSMRNGLASERFSSGLSYVRFEQTLRNCSAICSAMMEEPCRLEFPPPLFHHLRVIRLRSSAPCGCRCDSYRRAAE